ncbi:cytochrome c oxidase subunit II [Niabella beijingensis]|uniref:cytochrome c oxidase subunit II n=1 Tax=Niabella beijingensis TaxID=2872700 RepID=UPI001CBB7F55|nr:cytochrome c oxidase subunit II [Niabella beijingensis]MBZ4189058.1 cytochrome c oxidase subunit II [Niabella beijingensis]
MQNFLIFAILILGFIITFQIARASEFVSVIRGEEKTRKQTNKINAVLLLVFLIVGLFGVYWAHHTLGDKILKLGTSASDHGILVDRMLKYTIITTGIVFFGTQILLFWYSFKYRESENRSVYYFPHNNKLELLWTVVPAIVLTILIGFGIVYWYRITGAAPENAMQIEITGSQFKWEFRYPGKDGVFGKKYYKNIDEAHDNPLGQIWEDAANHDDIYVSGQPMHLVVGKPVRLIIGAKDVIHSVGLPHFRLKMDAVPGTPTTLWFTPIKTTKDMIKETGNSKFVYEIACDQMCGAGHTGMRGEIVVETQEEYDQWMASQKPKYVLMKESEGGPATPAAAATASKDSAAAPAVKDSAKVTADTSAVKKDSTGK